MDVSFELDRQAAGLIKDRVAADQLDRDYVRREVSAAVEQFRAKTGGEGWIIHIVQRQ